MSARTLDESYQPKKGDRILCALTPGSPPYSFSAVTRVARDGSWADLQVYAAGAYWSKRQPLPWQIKGATLAAPNHDDAYLLGLLLDPSRTGGSTETADKQPHSTAQAGEQR